MAKDFPPGAAHTSSTRSPFRAPVTIAVSRAAASCTVQRPSAKAGSRAMSPVPVTSKQPVSHGCACTCTPDARSSSASASGVVFSVFVCITVGTGSLSKRRNSSASCSPTSAINLSTSHLGWLYCTVSRSAAPLCGSGGKAFLLAAHFRSTAFTIPAARLLPCRFTSSTVSWTAALSGTLSMNSI